MRIPTLPSTSAMRWTYGLTAVCIVCVWAMMHASRPAANELAFDTNDANAVSARQTASRLSSRTGGKELVGRTQAITQTIETIRVGQRVLTNSVDASSESITEPEWSQWLRIKLVLANADLGESATDALRIELLRPEAWLLENVVYSAHDKDSSDSELTTPQHQTLGVPLREFYQDQFAISAWLDDLSCSLGDMYIELDMPHMGGVGLAKVIEITACPPIEPGQGRVVTATFQHPSTTTILDVLFADERGRTADDGRTIGVTDNHPFWSVDHQDYVPIGQLPIGTRVLTYQGDTKRIASKLPRPGPAIVYNLEVFGDHVYHVGQDGILVHNDCKVGELGEKATKGWLKRNGYTDIMQFQNPSGHGIDIVARHRDGTLTFFEVKTSTGPNAPKLSDAQSNPNNFINSRLTKAANGGRWWNGTPPAVRKAAQNAIDEIGGGAKIRRYVIEITNATNPGRATKFRIFKWR